RLLHPHRAHELALVRERVQRPPLFHRGEPRRARAARWRGGEVGADPAPDVAARRDGRPDAGKRADPRSDDGYRGRLPNRAHASDLRAGADEQDIRKLRGVGAMMPWTKWAFLVGAAALVGVPAFSGFFSKDPILAADLHDHWYGVLFAVCGLVGTFLTGLYTFRLYFIVFP